MEYIKDLYHDEIRNGFLVTSDRKKVWNRFLEIWSEVDRICRKHKIKYQISWGTLLGAVRHKGFIPWDDDFDMCMMRSEYNRFMDVLDDELNDEFFEVKHKTFGITKIVHKNTTMIYSLHDPAIHLPQGIFIEIGALDIAPDGTENSVLAFNAIQEILTAVFSDLSELYENKHLKNGGQLVMELDVLKKIAAMPFDDRLKELYRYVDALWEQSTAVAGFTEILADADIYKSPLRKEFLSETIYLPFETVELPVPKRFDEVLTCWFGDWRTPVCDNANRLGIVHSADIPWREFFRKINLQQFA